MKSVAAATVIAVLASLTQGAAVEKNLIKRDTIIQNVQHTFYGYPDNSPPGPATAYDCGRGYTAGGSGTYDDPLTMATAPGEFNQCEIVWDPYTEKYLIFQDTCAQCIDDWDSGNYHIDIWTGSSTSNGGQAQIDCEDELTPDAGHDVVRDGSTGHAVNTGSLYSSSAGCETQNVYPNNN